ncbi:hypothetical protein LIER_40866 [Lithospermum erythrorhizon]|uniref:Uncharacterized protein n=1 Tax=Lithospermum erythrorhizon TaxID=34254 RepID=A0AAV3R3V1_LITER
MATQLPKKLVINGKGGSSFSGLRCGEHRRHYASFYFVFASRPPMVYDFGYDEKEEMMDEDDGEYYETDVVLVEDIRWDAMFQDLKPT